MAEKTTVAIDKELHSRLYSLKSRENPSFNAVIADLVRVAEQHDSDRHSVGEGDAICPKH